MAQVRIDLEGLKRMKKATDPKRLQMAVKLALNSVTKKAMTAASAAVREEWNIKKKKFDEGMKISTYATVDRPFTVITVRSRPLGIIHFGASMVKVKVKPKSSRYKKSRITRYAVKAQIKKKNPRKRYRGMFYGTGRTSGSRQIFQRKGESRHPIFKPAVISPTTMFKKLGHPAAQEKFEEAFVKEVERLYKKRIGV